MGNSGRKKERLGLAAVMSKSGGNDKARDDHFVRCALNEWYEQIPKQKREVYRKRITEALAKRGSQRIPA